MEPSIPLGLWISRNSYNLTTSETIKARFSLRLREPSVAYGETAAIYHNAKLRGLKHLPGQLQFRSKA